MLCLLRVMDIYWVDSTLTRLVWLRSDQIPMLTWPTAVVLGQALTVLRALTV